MTDATVVPEPQVWLALRYSDAPAAIEFLTAVFGFELVVRYDNADDATLVDHAQLRWPGGGSGIMLGSQRDSPQWPASDGQACCYVSTDDVRAVYDRVRAAGFRLISDIHPDEYTGGDGWAFATVDPEGNLWSFGTYRGEPIRG